MIIDVMYAGYTCIQLYTHDIHMLYVYDIHIYMVIYQPRQYNRWGVPTSFGHTNI